LKASIIKQISKFFWVVVVVVMVRGDKRNDK